MKEARQIKEYAGICLLSAVDGLLFGIVVEWARRIATPILRDYYLNRELNETGYVPSITTLLGGYFDIPLLSTIVFAIVIPPLYFWFRAYFRSFAVLWQVLGLVAVTVAVLAHAILNPFGHNTWLLSPVWRWVLCLPLVSILNLVFGLSLQLLKKPTWTRLP